MRCSKNTNSSEWLNRTRRKQTIQIIKPSPAGRLASGERIYHFNNSFSGTVQNAPRRLRNFLRNKKMPNNRRMGTNERNFAKNLVFNFHRIAISLCSDQPFSGHMHSQCRVPTRLCPLDLAFALRNMESFPVQILLLPNNFKVRGFFTTAISL